MIRSKIKCTICNRDISKSNYTRHYDKCSGKHEITYNSTSVPKTEKWYAAMKATRGTTARNQYSKAKELGLSKPEISEETRHKLREAARLRGSLSEETKQKISKSRIKYLRENPHMVPYRLNHYSNGRSYPEEYWKEILDSNNISYVEQYKVGPYQLDFAIIDSSQKIDLEIDGEQHHLDERIVASDLRRNKYLQELGWKIIRIRWSDYKKLTDKKTFVDSILTEIAVP